MLKLLYVLIEDFDVNSLKIYVLLLYIIEIGLSLTILTFMIEFPSEAEDET